MTDTDRVLASIDETLNGYVSRDYDLSPDAMRWQPERPVEAPLSDASAMAVVPSRPPDPRHVCSPPRAYWAPVGALAGGPDAWTEIGHVTDDGFDYGSPQQAWQSETARRLHEQITFQVHVEALRSAFASIGETVKQVGKAFKKIVDANHPMLAPVQYGDDYRRHRIRCRLCNPAGNPKPLMVNGAEYRRRTRARRRRNRR